MIFINFSHLLPPAQQDQITTLTNQPVERVLDALSSFNFIAALLAKLYGQLGHLPAVIRSQPAPAGTMQAYTVAKILNLQASS